MSVSYGNLHVDERYSGILEPNLYYNSVFAAGVTFTDKYEIGPAGGIFVHKLATSACAPGTPGRDFTDEASQDDLIPIVLNNNFQKSKKIYGVQAAAVEIALAEEQLSIATKEVGEGWNQAGLACLINEGTASAATTTASTSNFKKLVLAERKAIVDAKGMPDTLLVTPEFMAIILEAAGQEYTPERNEFMNQTGQVGTWLGMRVVEAAGLSAASATYYDAAGTLTTVSFNKVEFIMYNHEALSIVDNFDVARIVDSENFAGSKAQVELNSGFTVTNANLVRIKKHA